MWALNLFIGGALLLLGWIFRIFDAYDGISGFSTMSDDEKRQWDIIGAGRFISYLMMGGGLILTIGGILYILNIAPLVSMIISWIFMILGLIFGMVYINVSHKFKIR